MILLLPWKMKHCLPNGSGKNAPLIDKRVTKPSAQLVQLSLIEIVRKRGQLALRLYIVGNLAMALTWMATGTALLANLTGDVAKIGC